MGDAPAPAAPLAVLIANRLRLASNYLRDVRLLQGAGSRSSAYHLFMAAETVLLAIMASEGLPGFSRGLQHQLAAMIDEIPDENPAKLALRRVEGLSAYATTFRYTRPTGRIPPSMPGGTFDAQAEVLDGLVSLCGRWFRVSDLSIDAREPAGSTKPLRAPRASAT